MRGGRHRNEGDRRLLALELIHGSNLHCRESGGIQFVADGCDLGVAYAKVEGGSIGAHVWLSLCERSNKAFMV
jgi:hypothetical protein